MELKTLFLPAALAVPVGAATGYLIGKAAGEFRKSPFAGAVCAVLIILKLGLSLKALYVFAVFCILLAITIIDFRKMEIPDGLTLALVPFAVVAAFDGTPVLYRIIGFFVISVPMLIMAVVVDSSFGGGDIKLIAVCGFMLGMADVLLAMFIAVLLGGVVAAYLILSRKKEKSAHIPFGPYICAGVFASLLAGDELIGWYLAMLFK